MRRLVSLLIVSTIVMLNGVASRAQMQPGMIDMTPSINASLSNYNHDRLMETLKGRNAGAGKTRGMIALEKMERAGAARIKAGKATLTFAPNVAATRAVAKSMTWNDEGDPKDLTGQIQFIQRHVKDFNTLAVQNGYQANNFADGYAFAYALSYAAYYDKDMDKAKVEELRNERRTALLKTASFQGDSDLGRQYIYEQNVVMAMQAVEKRAKYRRAKSETERQKYEAEAKDFANYLLEVD